MKKYSFWVFHQEYATFLESLRELGVVHIQEKGNTESDTLNAQLKQLQRYNNTLKGIEKVEADDNTKALEAENAVTFYEEQMKQIDTARSESQKVEKEIKQVEVWGAFDSERIQNLQSQGVYMHFYSAPTLDEEKLKDYNYFVIKEQSSKVYFVVVSSDEKAPELEAEPIALPNHSAQLLNTKLTTLKQQGEEAQKALKQVAASVDNIKAEIKKVSDAIALTQAQLNTESIANDKAMLIEGYAPVEKEEALENMLKGNNIFFTSKVAKADDDVPILLKNNRFNRLFEVISDLYSKPRYNEFDLTPFFGIFYMIFFGFCLGDTGYGLIYLLAATLLKRKADENIKPVISLVQLLSLSTIVFGILGGTFFGIELYKTGLPGYRHIADSLVGVEGTFVKNPIQDMMLKASIALGLVQMLLGMFINAFKIMKQEGFKYSVSAFSWPLFFIFSGANAAYINGTELPFWNPAYIALGGASLMGIFFFNSPGKNPLVNFGAGLWDAYNNIVGGIGDLLSYMRLFALALASSILGLVFNTLGLKVLNTDGNILTIILTVVGMLLIMAVGHAMNIFMSTLSSAVHPLRLTFVEFYKNAGFEGGGKAYKPFQRTK